MFKEFMATSLIMGLLLALAAQAAKAEANEPTLKPMWLVGANKHYSKVDAVKAYLDLGSGAKDTPIYKCSPVYADWTMTLKAKRKVK